MEANRKRCKVVMLPTDEIWKGLSSWGGHYEVSNLGNVRSLDRWVGNPNKEPYIRKGRILKKSLQSTGYETVGLTFNGKTKNVGVHRLVAIAFLGMEFDKEVNHINGDKTDNRVENLEWCTKSENATHARKLGLATNDNFIREKGEANANSKLNQEQVDEIRKKYVPYKYSAKKLAQEYGVSQSCIQHIISRRSW